MKIHLPLGLRRALFNTFLVLSATAAVAAGTAQANLSNATDVSANTYTNTAYWTDTTTHGNGSNIFIIEGKENATLSLGQGNYVFNYQKLANYVVTDENGTTTTYTPDDTGYVKQVSTQPADLVVKPSMGGDGTTFITKGQIEIIANSILFHGYTDFSSGMKTSCQVTLGDKTVNQWSPVGNYALYDGTGVTAQGKSDFFTLTGDVSTLTANKSEVSVTDSDASMTSLTVNGTSSVTLAETATTTDTMTVGTLKVNDAGTLLMLSDLTTTNAGTIAGTLNMDGHTASLSTSTITGEILNATGVTAGNVEGGTIDATGAVTVGAVSKGSEISGSNITAGAVTNGLINATGKVSVAAVTNSRINATGTTTNADKTTSKATITAGSVSGSELIASSDITVNGTSLGATLKSTDGGTITVAGTTDATAVTAGEINTTGSVLVGSIDNTDPEEPVLKGKEITGGAKVYGAAATGTSIQAGDVTGGSTVSAGDGSITVSNVTASTVSSNGGKIDVKGTVSGSSTVKSTNGAITVAKVTDGSIENTNGSIGITTMGGGTAATTGTGAITITNMSAGLATSSQGNISITGQMTGGKAANTDGAIEVGTLNGGAVSTSGSGSITVTTLTSGTAAANATGGVTVTTMEGGTASSVNGNVSVGTMTAGTATSTHGNVSVTTMTGGTATSTHGNVSVATMTAGTATSTHGNVTIGKSNVNGGTMKAENGTLTVEGGSANNSTLAAGTFTNTADYTIFAGKVDFDTTTVGKGTTLTVREESRKPLDITSDLGEVTVAGPNTVLEIEMLDTGINGDISVSDGGTLTIDGTYGLTNIGEERVTHTGDIEIDGAIVSNGAAHASATLTNTLLKGDVTVQNAGVLTLTASKVNGDVTLGGTSDTLNMKNSAITGTLTAGNGSAVNVTGANTAGNIRLETGADLVYTDAASTLTSNVTVNGTGSSATIGQTGMTGDLTVEDGGKGTIVAGATLTGNIELQEGQVVIGDDAQVTGGIELTDADTNHGDRTLTIEGDFAMTKDTDLYINTHDEHEAVNTVDVQTAGKTFTVEDLTGAGDFNLKGAGNVLFQGDDSTHSGDIVSTLTGDITASVKNSLGEDGALVLNPDDQLKAATGTLYIYGDQDKDITINRTGVTLSTNNGTEVKDVTLNGVFSGNALVLDNAKVTLANGADDLKSVTVNANSTLTTTTGGTYDNVTNLGSTTMDKATVGTLRNEGVIDIDDSTVGTLVNDTASATTSTVTGGTLGGVDNEDGTLTITGTAMLAGADVTNKDGLTLDSVTNAKDANDHPTVAGTLENVRGTLTVKNSDIDFATANLGGTVNVTSSQLTTTGKTTISGTTTMSGKDSSLTSGEEGTDITGSVLGTGDITSDGTVAVTGNIGTEDAALVGDIEAAAVEVTDGLVNLQGTMTTGEMDVTEGSTVAITGNGLSEDGVGSSLGEVTVTGSSLTLTNDEFSGNIAANAATEILQGAEGEDDVILKTPGVVEIKDAEYTGNVSATDSNVRIYDTDMTGDITGTDSNVLLSGSTLRGVLTVNSHTPDGVGLEKSTIIGKVNIVGNVELNGKNDLHATADSVIDGAIGSTTADGSLHKYGENLTLTGDDADGTKASDYTVHVHEGSLTLDNTARKGKVEAEAGTTIKVQGGASTVGDLVVYGNGNAAHSPAVSDQATIVEIGVAGQDKLVSATGGQLSAYDASGARGAQLVIKDWSEADTFTGYTDGQKLMVGEGISGFDKEIVHDRVTQNVNLVEELSEDGATTNSYAAISINHKGATKNKYQQGVSDAIVSAEGVAAEGSRLDEMIHALSHTGNEQDAKDALDCIGGAGIATTMAAQMSANRDHMRTLRHSIGQPEPLPYTSLVGTAIRRTAGTARPHEQKLQFPTRLWAEATGSSADLGSDRLGGMGYTRNDWGVLVGSDVTLSNTALVGLAAGYSRSHVNALNHTISGDQYFVDLFTRVNACRTTHTATIGVGFFDWDLDRNVHVSTEKLYEDFAGQGKGQTKGMAFNFSYEAAYNIRINEKHTLAPVFQVESSINHINGYSEKAGTLGNAGLNVEFDNTFVTTLGLGLHYSYEFDGFNTAENKGSLGARAMLIGDVGDAYGTMHGSFIGGGRQFEAESTRISRQGILLGVDALVPVSKQWAIFGSADFEIRDDYRDISGGIGARYTF